MKSIIKKIKGTKILFAIFFAAIFFLGFSDSYAQTYPDGCNETSNGHNCDEWYFEGTYPNFTDVKKFTCKNNDDVLGDYSYALGRTARTLCIRNGEDYCGDGWGNACSVPCSNSADCGACECRCLGPNLYCADIFYDNSDRLVSQTCKATANSSRCVPTAKISSYSVTNGSCGTRSDNYSPTLAPPYPYTTTTWPTGSTWCAKGTGTNLPNAFPAAGSSVSWKCEGGNVSFSGTGSDPSGNSIVAYQWVIRTYANEAAKNYSQDIIFYTQNFSTNLSPDSYYVYLRVKPTTLVWSSWVRTSVTIKSPANCSASRSVAPINGTCGTNAKTYPYTATAWPSTSNTAFCATGDVPATKIVFPAAGLSVSWICGGANGGTDTACFANRGTSPGSTSVTLTAVPASVYKYIPGSQATTLTWTPVNADWCWAWNSNGTSDWGGSGELVSAKGGSLDLYPQDSVIYNIECGMYSSDEPSQDSEFVSVCGDGNLQLGEYCDDGNNVNTDTCNNACEIIESYECMGISDSERECLPADCSVCSADESCSGNVAITGKEICVSSLGAVDVDNSSCLPDVCFSGSETNNCCVSSGSTDIKDWREVQ